MPNKDQIREVKNWLKAHGVPEQKWDLILDLLGYDLWEVKSKESHAIQRNHLKRVEKKATNLLKELKEIPWKLSDELHNELNNKFNYSPSLSFDEDEDEDVQTLDLKFERGLEEGRDSQYLLYLHNEELEDAFSHIPVTGEANVFDYMKNLITSCQELTNRKTDTCDVELYKLLTFRCERIAEEYSFELSQEQIFQFICACIGKERDTVKKQFQRLNITTSKQIENRLDEVENLEKEIVKLYRQEWETVFNHKLRFDGEVNQFWTHWELVEFYNAENRAINYPDFLRNIVEIGVGDILEKYGLDCPLPD